MMHALALAAGAPRGGLAVADFDPIRLAVRDATAIGAGSLNGSGWTADVRIKGMSVGGTWSRANAALTLSATRAGYDASGAPTSVTDVINGTLALRQPADDGVVNDVFIQSASGPDVDVTVVLDRRVYQGDVLSGCSIGAGAYVQAENSSAAKAITTLVNGSTLAVPTILWGWAQPQYMLASGSSFRVELAVVHCEARNGQQVPRVEFGVRGAGGGTDLGVLASCTSPSLSTYLTGSGCKVEVYAADIPQSALTQGVAYEVYPRIYPWVGQVYDGAASAGQPTTASLRTVLRFVCDKASSYVRNVAFVQIGATGPGAVQAPGTASSAVSSANRFTTINAALAALRSANNNAGYGADQRNNAGGSVVYLMESSAGAGADHLGQGSAGTAMSTIMSGAATYATITTDPLATGAVRIISAANTGHKDFRFCQIRNQLVAEAASLGTTNDDIIFDNAGSHNPIWLDGVTYTGSPSNFCAFRRAMVFITNGTFTGAGNQMLLTDSGPSNFALIGGATVTCANSNGQCGPTLVLGNLFTDGISIVDTANGDSKDGGIVGWNKLYKIKTVTKCGSLATSDYAIGFAWVNNLTEVMTNGANASLQNFADACNANVANYVTWHNTDFGDRVNEMYSASSGQTRGKVKTGAGGFNLRRRTNAKSDYESVQLGNADGYQETGNWAWRYGVDRVGWISIDGDSNANSAYQSNAWIGEVSPRSSSSDSTVTVVADKSNLTGDGLGGGDYHLTGVSNDAYGRVPAGRLVFKYDLDGNLRANDGSEAAGCYRR